MQTTLEAEARLEAQFGIGSSAPSKRMLVIVNPYATTVSERLKHLVVYALRGRYEVDAIDTQGPSHATELGREAARDEYDVVVAFGGDGTVNEAANGLAGSGVPLTCLPGGRANVYCRMLGIPADVVDATEHLLLMADTWRPRRVDLGRIDLGAAGQRYFTFSAGAGLDASVVEQVDAHPRLKARLGEYYYAWVATSTFTQRYLLRPPRLEAIIDDERVTGVTAIVQNATPYTYFGDRPVNMGVGAALDSGDLAGVVLRRSNPLEIPTIAWRALYSGGRGVGGHRQVHPFTGLHSVVVRSLDERPLPIQVDGDFIGVADEAVFGVVPRGLSVVA